MPSRWHRGRRAGRAVAAVTAALVGFLVVSQTNDDRSFVQRLEAEDEDDLVRILASLNTESAALRREIGVLETRLRELSSTREASDEAVAGAERELEQLRVLAGTVPVIGPGISVRIDDPGGTLTYDVMIDLVQELRDAGAEAIAVDGHRVGATSAFAQDGRAVLLDGSALRTPIRVLAVGDPATLEGGLAIPGGAADSLRALEGVEVRVQRRTQVELPPLDRPPSFDVARPITSDG